jgi:iron complex outermembrane receptor protein
MKKKYMLLAAVSAISLPHAAFAQKASEAEADTDDIIVTAQKREQTLQDIPAAVTAASGQVLAQTGITNQTELAKLAPGLVLSTQAGLGFTFLRGVGQTLPTPNAAPAVSVNFNGMFVPSESGFTPLFDIERVEILPGPQGTLYGRASAGGAINFITKKPTQEFGGNVRAEVGDYSAIMVSGALNVPLGAGLALRLSGIVRRHDSYQTNNINDENMWAGRAMLSYDADGPFSGTITFQRHHEGGRGTGAIQFNGAIPTPTMPDPDDLYNSNVPDIGQFTRANTTLLVGNFNLKLGDNVDLTYIPGYSKTERRQVLALFGLIPADLRTDVVQYSQELRLAGNNSTGDWVLGLYWLHSPHRNFYSDIALFGGVYAMENKYTSYAGFAEYRLRATHALTLTAGARYSHDTYDGRNYQTYPPAYNGPASDSRGHFDFKLGAEYELAPDSLIYATLQTGYVPAGFANGGVPFAPAKLTAYTIGSKNKFLDGALTANLELFYYDYKNFQLQFYQLNGSFGSASVPARIMGGEFKLALRLGSDDVLGFNGLVQSARMLDETNLYDRDGVFGSVYGLQLPYAPDVTLNGNWSHTFRLANERRIVAQVNTMYSSSYWMQFTHDKNTQQKGFTKTDASLTYFAPDDRWSIGAFVRNIENNAVLVGANKPVFPGAFSDPFLRPPRTYGISFHANF